MVLLREARARVQGAHRKGSGARRPGASSIVAVLALMVGILLLLYPSLSNLYNQIGASYIVDGYVDYTGGLSDDEKAAMLADAEAYNDELPWEAMSFFAGEPHDANYASLLNPRGDGVMGFLTINKIGVQLPIYHGTEEIILTKGVGHVEGSSLSVGGGGTHAVLMGHRGLPSARLFTDLDKMGIGDTFVISVLGRKLTYQVDGVTVVEPEELNDLEVREGEDRVTLVTCTPYAVNTQRLLVSGTRIPNGPEPVDRLDAAPVDPLAVVFAVVAVIAFVIVCVVLVRRVRRRRQAFVASGKHRKR